ncbi:MAG: hypothetical protein Q6365_006040, partial [Candidatus Sigynarchaeota archaeon]
LLGHVVYFRPRPVGFTTVTVGGEDLNVAIDPIIGRVEATLVSYIRATFTNSWTRAVQVEAYFGRDTTMVYPTPLVFVFSAGTWNVQVSRNTPGIESLWQAGRTPGMFYLYFNVTDTYRNYYTASEFDVMPRVAIYVVDRLPPVVDASVLNAFARDQILDSKSAYEIKVSVAIEPGASFTRTVVLYYTTVQPSGNTLAAWMAAGAKSLKLSLISSANGEWMCVLPPQEAGSEFYWAIYAQDYAMNDNSGNLLVGSYKLRYAPAPLTEALETPVGYLLIGVLGFGIVFAISYRVQQGVQSVKKAKKVSAAVKKAPGKTIGGTTGSKTPISKDIPTKICPICKAKIGADLGECPYCHKKF